MQVIKHVHILVFKKTMQQSLISEEIQRNFKLMGMSTGIEVISWKFVSTISKIVLHWRTGFSFYKFTRAFFCNKLINLDISNCLLWRLSDFQSKIAF